MKTMDETSGPHSRSGGFTLIELMIVIAIIGILAAVAVPQYTTYTKRARFSEVVLAVTAYKSSMEIAVQTGRATNVDVLDSGNFGIPANKTTGTSASQYVESVTALDGTITGIGTNEVDDGVYVIKATIPAGTTGIRWIEDNSNANACQKIGLC